MNNQLELKKAYVKLNSLKKNLPAQKNIEEKYANIFNTEIERLINIGFDVTEFKIASNELKRIFISGNYITGESEYSKELYVSREILLMNLDSILAYFSILNPETKIGFNLN